jgi:hypothetical protein
MLASSHLGGYLIAYFDGFAGLVFDFLIRGHFSTGALLMN